MSTLKEKNLLLEEQILYCNEKGGKNSRAASLVS